MAVQGGEALGRLATQSHLVESTRASENAVINLAVRLNIGQQKRGVKTY